MVSVDDGGTGFSVTAQVDDRLDPDRVCRLLLNAIQEISQALTTAPDALVSDLEILPEAERTLVVEGFNATQTPLDTQVCVHELFEQRAAAAPEAVAVVHGDTRVTYRDVNARANQIAHRLRSAGVGPDVRVGICAQRGVPLLTAMLGVLKAGGAYVPLDPNYPTERLAFMLADAQPAVILTDGVDLPTADVPVVDLASLSDEPETNLPNLAASTDMAYVLYTSGSTGLPKGVAVEHRNIVRLVVNNPSAEFTPQDRTAFAANPSFDAATWEIWGPLTNGGTIVVIDQDDVLDPQRFAGVLQAQSVSMLWMTVGLFNRSHTALGDVLSQLRYLVVGGDALDPSTIATTVGGPQHLLNGYGPTETTTFAATHLIETVDVGRSIPIGKPIGNTRIYLVDGYGRPVPVGVTGELFIGGLGVARGYLGRPGLTAERFVPDWLTGDGTRLYRTGDLGRWLPDGTIEFVGRNDFQVKVRGYRIELGEIEARLLEHHAVREAIVITRGDRLDAYYVADTNVEVETLRDALAETLPSYMVPSAFVALDALPLTQNGKVDRDKLPAPDGDAVVVRGYQAPVGLVEEKLAAIWADLLGVERVGRDDDFFELGGHSLLAVSLVERMREAGLTCDIRAVFTTPTITGLATAVAAGGGADLVVPPNAIPADAEAITPDMLPLVTLTEEHITQVVSTVPGGARNVQDIYPLGPLQEGIFFHHLMGGDVDPYLISVLFAVDTRDDVDRFVTALQAVVDRHDILRTSVAWEGLPQPVQVVWRHADLPVEEVSFEAGRDASEQLQERRFGMPLDAAPLMRIVVGYDATRQQWLMMVLRHHIIDDNTSVGALVSEVNAHLDGRADALPEPVPYRNVVAQAVLGTSREEHEKFFTGLLGDVDEPTAPYGVLDVRGDGTGVAEARVDVDPALARTVREQARRAGVSPASMCHLAWSMVLSRLTGRSDVVFGTVLFGRMHAGAGAERGLGLFINTLPIRVDVDARDALGAVRDTHGLLADVLRHEHAPLVLAQGCSQVPAGLPLFTTLLNYRHTPESADEAAPDGLGERIEVLHSYERTNYPIVVSINDGGVENAGLAITAQVDDRLDPDGICGMLTAALRELADTLAGDRSVPLAAVDVLPAAERSLLVDGFNTTDTSADPKHCLHESFEAQAAATPDAVALVHRDTQVTYRELNEQANRIAHRLRAQGVGPGVRVGICAERGVGLLAAVVGVLKAGGAYVPLDPSYPAERVAFMLADAKPLVVLTDGAEPPALIRATAPEDAVVWDLATDFTDAPAGNVPVAVSPSDVAYVIYTSGSTGTPKGVLVEHRQVARLFTATDEWFGFGPSDVWALCHSYAFDFSVWEIWGALLHGGQLVIVPSDVVRAPDELWQLLCSAGVTVLCQTPGAFTRLTDARLRTPDTKDQLRFVIFGGEALEVAALRPWFNAAAGGGPTLVNMYGITETTVHVTWQPIEPDMAGGLGGSLIGRPIPDLNVYVVDAHGRPAPVGVVGELMVGGRGVTRGYLGRPGLTAERFVPNWLTGDGTRLYRTGDLGRWLPDGTLEYIGRNDFQVKVRGYRIELGEIEARLLDHDTIREATVIARDDRLNAYYVADTRIDAATLRDALGKVLPSYMVPSAFVALDALPLTPNGKVDRDKLPAPDGHAVVARGYQAPVGPVEQKLSSIWADLLGVERVGRDDDFFELGGHSLLAVSLVEQMRQAGLSCDVRAVFTTPTVAGLATAIAAGGGTEVQVPPNAIPADAEAITPDMLPLVELTEDHITQVVSTVPGGAANVQDIYPLAPLQEGIFFHHLMGGDTDPYLVSYVLPINTRAEADQFVAALQTVMDRHDILRTAVVWEGLPHPVQVVWRHTDLPVEDVALDGDEDAASQLLTHYDPRRHRLDLNQAPLLRVVRAYDAPNDRWLLLVLMHHLVGDHTTLEVLQEEIGAVLNGRTDALPKPVPYRNAVAQAVLGTSQQEHQEFFRDLLGDIDEPTAPYGIHDVRGDGTGITEAQVAVEPDVAGMLREQARQAGVSPASVFHLAWSMVLSRLTGRSDVVFGTVLFGRLQAGAGAERGLGLFINTLPIRVDVGARGALDAVRDTHGLLAEVLRHEHAPLVLAQGSSQVPTGLPLFTTLLNYRHNAPADPATTEAAVSGFEVLHSEERTNYPIVVSVNDLGDAGLSISAQVDDRLDPERISELMVAAVRELTQALASRPTAPVSGFEVLPAAERTMLVEGFNATETPVDTRVRLHELFEARAQAAPDAVALLHDGGRMSYGELDRTANRIAHRLRAAGVRPDVRVGICARRGVPLIAAILGVLKAGGAYVPLDPSYPAERLAFMLADARPAVVLTDGTDLPADDVLSLDLTTDFTDQPETAVTGGATGADAAYVIYTSGSTGTPKGVVVEHRSVVNRIGWMQRAYPIGQDDVILQKTPMSFDVSVWEFFWWMTEGASLCLLESGGEKDPDVIAATIERAGVTTMHFVPAMLSAFLDAVGTVDLPSLRQVFASGEALPPHLVRKFHRAFSGPERPRLINLYGPTEATVDVTHHPCHEPDPTLVPIGRPIDNTRLYVVDGCGRPVPVGVVGELFIGGLGVARGYLGRPGLTAERFVPDWLTGDGSRLYRTGDLGRWLPDGTLEYIGRNDFQVKVRGYRIELGEIETRLLDQPTIREAIVVAHGDRLDAYYVADTSVDVETLRDALGKALPSYMVPSAFVALDALPLTPNGKVDRDKLPAPDGGAVLTRGYQAPVGVVEEVLAAIWADLLSVERVGRDDDFFELGGHSLLAVSLVERMRAAGLSCDVRAVFTTPTVAGLATAVAAGGGTEVQVPPNAVPADAEAITPDMLPLVELSEEHIATVVSTVPGGALNVQDIYPLAPLQEGIFFHHLMGADGDPYLGRSLYAAPSRESVTALTTALQTVVDRHDILRTSVVWEGLPQPVQVVRRHTALPVDEVTVDGAKDAVAQLQDRYDPRRYRLDLNQAPLLRLVTAYDEPNDRWLLLVLMHHLIGDNATWDVLQKEIGAVLADRADVLPEPVRYRNVVAQAVLGTSREEHEEFFTGLLGDIDEPTAPYGIHDVRGDGTGIAEARVDVDAALARTVREQARRAGVSPASVCHLAWGLVLSRLTGRSDVVFGSVLLGRMQAGAGADRAVGMFVNTLPVRVDAGVGGVFDAVRGTQRLLAEVLRHEHAPLVLAQGCSQVPTGLPLFTSLFNYRHNAPADPAAAEAALGGFEVLHSEERTNYPVVVSVDDGGTGLSVTAQVDDRLDPDRVCGLLLNAIQEIGQALNTAPETPVSDLEILPEAERALVVDDFNATEAPFDPTARLHERFETHAKTTPDAIAVTHGDTQLTYRELNAKANQVAHRLRTAGVGPDVRVGICAPRGIPLLTAMLGTLKAGGAYVPMDPSFPAERTAFMLADARPTVVLTDGMELPEAQMPVIDLASLTDEPDTDLPNLAASTDMAYVLYTSGSTGLPKGVAVEHRSIIRLVVDNPYVDFTPEDRTAFAANPSFDAATWEIWGPLTNGGTIVVIDQDTFLNPRQLATTLAAHGVTGLFTTTALFNQTAAVVPDAFAGLRYLFTGGERCDPAAFTRILDSGAAPQRLIHCYGPTETTTFATTHDVTHVTEGQETLPIGAPIGNTHIYIVDNLGRPAP
ncbi:non-ribosomal peptide synthetase [Streptomyces sp. RTd22]|uniref:non-ribosomal peptide synthetase n=1 Tax=Streptomyces sp. RTd22 TaxID=1841249 RepID=UPI001F36905C|nr:non-ribosomal peptide synthetase [Streptomyces sp. RTd22]